MLLRRAWLAVTFGFGLLSVPGAHAENVAQKLVGFEAEANALADLPRLNQPSVATPRRLVDGIVAFRLGDYDTAAITLYELVMKGGMPPADAEQATYYLAETLYQKGDKGAARNYYTTLAASTGGKYSQPALLRLVEISIVQKEDAAEVIAKLNQVSPGSRAAGVPYVLGKYAFSNGNLDEAATHFNDVPKGSELELQALYYGATIAVAKKDLQKASDTFTDLISRKPKSAADRRVIELSQLALGRLYYERDQFSKSIDSYLLVHQKSDLFSDALYEVAWVYVKNKQFDKALRALELLAESDPDSTKTPTVKLLEGNLRIRKAQILREEEISGRLDAKATVTPDVEYDKATAVFAELHRTYYPAWKSLTEVVDGKLDPTHYIMQIAGRTPKGFQATLPIPEAAAQWLRDEPEVQRFVAVESDLGRVQADLDESESIIVRLENVLATNDKTAAFPELARKRSRIGQIQDELIKVRSDLADQGLRLVDSNGELSGLSGTRKTLVSQYAGLGDPEKTYADRIATTHQDYSKLEEAAATVATEIEGAQAVAVALRKHLSEAPPTMTAEQKAAGIAELNEIARETAAMSAELDSINRELQLGRDLVGAGDESVTAARALRKQVKTALDNEHRVLAGFAASSRSPGESKSITALGDHAARISGQLETTDTNIEQLAEKNVTVARATVTTERGNVTAYRAELEQLEIESREVEATVLNTSFANVKAKFYDVVIRADVGTVDVSWAQKSDTDDDLKRFNLNRSREMKQLKDEFKDILDAGVPKPSAPRKLEPMPGPADAGTSPDKGGPANRVKPIDDKAKPPSLPTVKPDETKPKTDPKKGATR